MNSNITLEKKNNNILNNITICTLNGNSNLCLPDFLLKNIYNNISDNNIPNNTNYIINKLSQNCGCESEKFIDKKQLCIIKNIDDDIIDKEKKDCIIHEFFKPHGDYDGKSWLNNTHIDLIQEQLYKKFSGYYYSFIHMIDNIMILPKNIKCVDHTVKQITDINFIDEILDNDNKELNENGKLKYYGIVYNTDPSYKSGQHWFSILFNFTKSGSESDPYLIEHFDSSGQSLDNKFRDYLYNLAFNIKFHTKKNIIIKTVTNIQHQKSDTGNCGIYSIYYIWSRISGIPINTFNDPNNKITDDTMEKFRKVLFRENE